MPTPTSLVVSTSSEAVGRRRFGEIIDELARPINPDDETIRALAGDAFRAAVRTMDRKGLWPWEMQDEDITITGGQRFVTASGVIKKPLAMFYTNGAGGTERQRIDYLPYDEFLEAYNLDVSGQAFLYTIPNLFETGQIRLYPAPTSGDAARFSYYRSTPPPRQEDETVEIPDYATEVYMAYAWFELMKRVPAAQQRFPLGAALASAQLAFREISAHIASPGDRTR